VNESQPIKKNVLIKPWIGLVLGLLLLLVLSLVASWWSAPYWVPPLAERLARQAGVELDHLDLGRLGWGGWNIQHLTIRTASTEFQIDHLILGWRCCERFSESLTADVEQLTIVPVLSNLTNNSEAASSTDEPAPFAVSALLQTLYQRIPFVELRLRKLDIQPLLWRGGEPWGENLSVELSRNTSGLQLTVQTSHKGQLGLLNVSWADSTNNLRLKTSFANAEVNLEGQLNNTGQWSLQGQHFVDGTTLAIFVQPDLKLSRYFDTLLAKGEFTGLIPDVFLAGQEWQASLTNTLLARVTSPVLNIEGTQKIDLKGVHSPEEMSLSSLEFRLKFPAGSMPSVAIPLAWQLSLTKPIFCALPMDRQCLHALPVKLLSKGDGAQASLSAISDLDASDLKAGLGVGLKVSFEQPESKPLSQLPKQMELQGRYYIGDYAKPQIIGNVPTQLSWRSLLLGEDLQADGEATLKRLRLAWMSGQKPNLQSDIEVSARLKHLKESLKVILQAPVNWQGDNVHLSTGTLKLFGLTENIEANYNVKTAKGWVSANGGGTLTNQAWIRSWLPKNINEVLVMPGTLENTSFFNLTVNNAGKVQGRSRLKLDGWRIEHDHRALKGVQVTADVQFTETELRLLTPLKVAVRSASLGVPLKNLFAQISGKVNWKGPLTCSFVLQSASLESFDGSVRLLQEAPLDCALTQSYLPVELRDLDLGQLVAVENASVRTTGRIAGLLPIYIRNGVFNIEDGQVAAQSAGTIKLSDIDHWRQIASGNPALGFAVDVLQNFQYKSLVSDVAFTGNELLLFNVALKGANPEFQKGQPVNLNVNISSNILSLLKSAEMPTELERRLEKRLQK